MARASQVVERMARAMQGQGYTRAQALETIILACDEMCTRYAGATTLNLAFVRAIQGTARRKLAAAPSAIVLPMRGQGTQRGKTQ